MPFKDKERRREWERNHQRARRAGGVKRKYDPAARLRHYAKHSDNVLALNEKHRRKNAEKIRRFLAEYLSAHPCIECGESDLKVLDFDHREPETKLFNMGKSRKGHITLSVVKLELTKCDVRCANCHRLQTARQYAMGYFRGRDPYPQNVNLGTAS